MESDNGSAVVKDPQNVRNVPPLNIENEFLMRIVQLPNDSGSSNILKNCLKDSAATPSASPSKKSGRVRRSARTPKFREDFLTNSERSIDVRWVHESELDLWEIKYMLDK